MLTINKILALPRQPMSQWEERDLSATTLTTIFSDYREVVISVHESGQDVDFIFSMNQFRYRYSQYNNTLSIFLQGLADPLYAFERMTDFPNKEINYVKYNHAAAAGYNLKLAKIGYTLPEDAPVDTKTDIRLTRPGVETDFKMLYDYCLFSVNGMVHRADYDGEYTYIREGGKSCQIADNNQVGIYSFRDIAKPDIVPITDSMLSVPQGFTALRDRVRIKLPQGKKIKSFFLVIGGYIVMPHANSCWVINDESIEVDVKLLSILERILESKKLIDLSSLELSVNTANPEAVDVEEIFSDRVIRNWMTLEQSFVVLLDTDTFFHNRIYLRQMRAPGIITAYSKPEYPLVLGQGRLGEYWRIKEDRYWSVTLTDSFRKNYQFRREFTGRLKTVDNALAFDTPFYLSQAYLLEIGSYGKTL